MNNEMCVEKMPITEEYLEKMNAYWRAANYLSAAQLYLLDNPLLREPLKAEHIKKKDSRTLGNSSWTEFRILPYEQGY